MARTIRYVNTASSGGDGTTNGTAGGTAAYVSIRSALQSINLDLSTITVEDVTVKGRTFSDIALEIICDNAGGDDTAAGSTHGLDFASDLTSITNFDNTHRVLIRAADDSWHDQLQWGTGYEYKPSSGTAGSSLFFRTGTRGDFCFAGIGFDEQNTSADHVINTQYSETSDRTPKTEFFACKLRLPDVDNVTRNIAHTLLDCCRISGGVDGIETASSARGTYTFSCLFEGQSGNGIPSPNTGVDQLLRWHNNVVYQATGDDYGTLSDSLSASHNASSDTTAWGTNTVNNIDSGDFVNAAGGNFTPAASGALDGVGLDLVTAAYYADVARVDAMGNTRPTGDTWAIGPLEPTASSGSALPLLNAYYYG